MALNADINSSSNLNKSPLYNDPTQGPIPVFELHLKVLSDSYISFFQERIRIEEVYIESLSKLHRKIKTLDSFLDDRLGPCTSRAAWREIRENLEREAQTRQAFLTTLSIDVLNPLVSMKDTQDRTRRRVRDDLKESANAHAEYSDNILPRLKKNYLRKCQDLENINLAAVAQPLSPSGLNQSIPPLSPVDNSGRVIPTAPQPLRPLTRRPSGQMPNTVYRARSPSTSASGTFSDLASHGKKQLSQLKTLLDKGNAASQGGNRADSAVRSVRTKRELEEADKEYRKGVHWLETLRLRRFKILEGAYKSLELFVHEAADLVKLTLSRYTNTMLATSTTQTQLASHALQMVEQISSPVDAGLVAKQIPKSLAWLVPKPVLYQNYSVGECKDLIFGVSLVDYSNYRSLSEGRIPRIVGMCIQDVESRGLEVEGIYRVSGRLAVVQDLVHRVERDERLFMFQPALDDVFAVSSLLKLYLRELPEPLFRISFQDRLQHSEEREEHISTHFLLLKSKIRRLPSVHHAVLQAVVQHLALIASHKEQNKMDAKNLSIVFGTAIFGEDDLSNSTDLLMAHTGKDSLMEDMILHAGVIFDEMPFDPPPSPPLPAAPHGEAPPPLIYGSSFTHVTNVPPKDQQTLFPPTDFAPVPPLQPSQNIHPSSRTLAPSVIHANDSETLSGDNTLEEEIVQHRPDDHSDKIFRDADDSETAISHRSTNTFATALTTPVETESTPSTCIPPDAREEETEQ